MKHSINHTEIFCLRLKAARLAKGFSQKRLGISAGIDEFVASARINRYEKGVHQASIETAQQLATALDVPLAYFYIEDDDLARFVLSWVSLSTKEKAKLLSILDETSSL